MSETPKISERIKVLKDKLPFKSNRALEKGGLPNDEYVISNGLLAIWEKNNVEWMSNDLDRFLNHYNVNREWWKTGEGSVFNTSVQKPSNNNGNGMTTKETFYSDLIEGNEEYSLIPRAVLKDYKIVPDKIIDVIIASNENEKNALKRSMESEKEALIKEYERVIQGLENKVVRLEQEKEDLRRQIPGQNQG